jgi:dTDP-4-amino-4,6-dideoxygalactose transaminase
MTEVKFLDLQAQYAAIKPAIDSAIADVISRAAFIGGSDVTGFEEAFALYQSVAHCIGVANGTDAIEIAIEALDLPTGSEIIVPANSFISSSEAVTRSGHRVVFADAEPGTYGLDLADVRRRITPRTSAVIVVHLYGHPANMDALGELAREHGLKVIEDCAQAHGAEWRGRRVGGLGDVATFSFYPGKNLGAYGDGGAITTNDAELAKRCRMIANHGRIAKYDHQFEGRNSRLDGLQAAILRAKLDHLDAWIDKRNLVAEAYLDALADIQALALPVRPKDGRHAYHLFVVRTDRRDELAAFLKEHGVQTGVHYPIALPKLEAYAYLGQSAENTFANRSDSTLLSLPIGDHMTADDARHVAELVRRFFAP